METQPLHKIRQCLEQPVERARLVRLCARLTSNSEAAEDLAQETLVEAWRHMDKLRDQEAWRPWLSGIARNVCLRWQSRYGREMSRRLTAATPAFLEEQLPNALTSPNDLDAVLERTQIADLLDRALGALPPQSRQMLVHRYVDEMPQAEIAGRMGINENAAAVRLHRSKQALRRVLTTDFRSEAAAFGLIHASEDEADAWQETRIWCPQCGQSRLRGRFVTDDTGRQHFKMSCSNKECMLDEDFSGNHPSFDAATVLQGVTSYKPALARVSAWWYDYFQRGLAGKRVPCWHCGRAATVQFTLPDIQPMPLFRGLYVPCHACREICGIEAGGFVLNLPQVQRFWRRHPRMRLLPERNLCVEGRSAVLIRYEDVFTQAHITVVVGLDDFQVLRIHQSPSR